uniref:Uncharacterized protein n=1 Tax=Arundo donax TaxID=35708 RepID=A0A0A9ET79_ARUDO
MTLQKSEVILFYLINSMILEISDLEKHKCVQLIIST